MRRPGGEANDIEHVAHLMRGHALQMFWPGHVRRAAPAGQLRKHILGTYDEFFIEYDCFGRDPRQAPSRDGLAFP